MVTMHARIKRDAGMLQQVTGARTMHATEQPGDAHQAP